MLHSKFEILDFTCMKDDTVTKIDDLRSRLRSVRSYL